MFDVYLPITVLAPALVYFTPAGISSTYQATIFYLVFSATLIGRPIGALIFGYFGDSPGRRCTILVSVLGLCLATFTIAMLRGHAAWGGFSIVALIVLRLVNGIFIGGEYTAANRLAMEYSPKDKRGLYGALIHIGYPVALVCISLLTTLMFSVASAGDADSAYATWGWRVPFLIGSLLSGIGVLSQRFGRRPTIVVIGLLNIVPACAGYYALIVSGYRDPAVLVFLVAFTMVPSLAMFAVHTPYLAESFPTSIRSSGYGVSLSLPIIIPGLYSFLMLGLSVLIPYAYTAIVLLALGGLLVSVGAFFGKETKDADFERQER